MTTVVKPPTRSTYKLRDWSVFLAGSIEMGTAEDWQEMVTKEICSWNLIDWIYNPRRDDWDSTWVQSIDNPQFKEQVEWEHDHLYLADVVFFYFSPETKSPITLMELGMVTGKQKDAIVVCPNGFWRKGNVEILCKNSNIPVFENLEDGLQYLNNFLKEGRTYNV